MQTTTSHVAGEIVLKVPKRLLITSDMAKSTKGGMKMTKLLSKNDLIQPLLNTFILLYHVLVDKMDPSSLFHPYYDTLPTELPGFPCSWTEYDLASLQSGEISVFIFLRMHTKSTAIRTLLIITVTVCV